jgi:hypothetical protein
MAGHRQIICPSPNCGYKGIAKQVARASRLVAVALLLLFLFEGVLAAPAAPLPLLTRSLLFVLPLILYMIIFRGYKYYCPKCGIQVGSDN